MGNKSQIIIFNNEGYILYSDEGIFETHLYKKKPINQLFLLVDSIFKEVIKIAIESPSIIIPAVTSHHHALPGYYDYHFKRLDKERIEWFITDKTNKYQEDRNLMQDRNDSEIKQERGEV